MSAHFGTLSHPTASVITFCLHISNVSVTRLFSAQFPERVKCCPFVPEEFCHTFCDCNNVAEMSLILFKICTTKDGPERTICCPSNHTESCKIRCDCSKTSNMTKSQLISKCSFGFFKSTKKPTKIL